MKKVLVTGGAGFIGSHTAVELVDSGIHPIIVDNFVNSEPSVIDRIEQITGEKITHHRINCTDPQALKGVFNQEGHIDGVIHFAAYKAVGESVAEPLKYYHNNVEGMRVLMQVMLEMGTKNLVFSSSCTVYGQPDTLPATEDTIFRPADSPYGTTKQICEMMIQDVHRSTEGKLNVALLRYFNPIGAHPSGLIGELPIGIPNNLVPFITQTAAQIREELTVFGNDYNTTDGSCVRDYIHVVDLAQAHLSAFQWLTDHPTACEAFNLGTGRGNSVLEVVKTFEKVTGASVNHKIGPRRNGDVEQIYASPTKAKTMLNWETKRSLDEALRDAWNWQQKLAK